MQYFYCIIKSKKNDEFGNIGIDGKKVYTTSYKDLCAVVSEMKNGADTEVLEEGITHQKVIERVMQKYDVIPLAFGHASKSEVQVKRFLVDYYAKLKMLFKKIEGRKELGIKASWKMNEIMKQIVESHDRIRILQKQVTALPEEKSYYLKIRLGQLVAEELKARGEAIAGEIFGDLKQLAAEAKMNNTLSERMILNAAFLVSKDNEAKFDEKVNEIEKKHPELILKYVVSPAYNFVSIR